MTQSYLYFAYGSNMLTRRLRQRTPSAVAQAVGFLQGHRLTFGKASTDGSGKCTIETSEDAQSRVYGMLYRIDGAESAGLDEAEGLGYGYDKRQIAVVMPAGKTEAIAYIATAPRAGLVPYDWYKRFVVAGAIEHGLPTDYITQIEIIESQADPDPQRRRRK